RVLFVDDQEVSLTGASVVQLGRERLAVFREGDYVHLRLRDEGRSLALRLAEALVVLHVLTSPRREDLLTVAKVIANTVRGEPQELVVQALNRANNISARAPDRRQALTGLWRGAARATGVDLDNATVAALVDKIMDAVTLDPGDVEGALERAQADEQSFHTLTGEPLTVELAGQKITVRQYRGRTRGSQESLVAMLPGQVLGSFTDYLIAPLGAGTLLFVRGDTDLAVLHLAKARLFSTAVCASPPPAEGEVRHAGGDVGRVGAGGPGRPAGLELRGRRPLEGAVVPRLLRGVRVPHARGHARREAGPPPRLHLLVHAREPEAEQPRRRWRDPARRGAGSRRRGAAAGSARRAADLGSALGLFVGFLVGLFVGFLLGLLVRFLVGLLVGLLGGLRLLRRRGLVRLLGGGVLAGR